MSCEKICKYHIFLVEIADVLWKLQIHTIQSVNSTYFLWKLQNNDAVPFGMLHTKGTSPYWLGIGHGEIWWLRDKTKLFPGIHGVLPNPYTVITLSSCCTKPNNSSWMCLGREAIKHTLGGNLFHGYISVQLGAILLLPDTD